MVFFMNTRDFFGAKQFILNAWLNNNCDTKESNRVVRK